MPQGGGGSASSALFFLLFHSRVAIMKVIDCNVEKSWELLQSEW